MAYTTIDDPSAHFQAQTYTGNAGVNNIVNEGNSDLQPDWVWLKSRDLGQPHTIRDSTRGTNKFLYISTADEGTNTYLTSFNSDGFSLNATDNEVNGNTNTYMAWQWKANGGTTSSDSNGDQTSTVQANTTAGFSIATFAASSSAGQTVGHGLGSAPDFYIWKSRARDDNWYIYHRSAGAGGYLRLNTTNALTSNTNVWSNTDPSSTVIYYGGNSLTANNENHVLYSFKSIKGYSKFGIYTGNGNADGSFVYTGFKPAWVMIKTSSGTKGWHIHDDKRPSYNPATNKLSAESNDAESKGAECTLDLLSNGFKCRSGDNEQNGDGDTYVYAAFAKHPFTSSKSVPVTAV